MTQVTQKQTWVAVINAEAATIYLYQGAKQKLKKLETLSHPLPKTSELVSDQCGRDKNQQMPGAETFAEPTDPRTHEKPQFSKQIADYLYDHHQEYDRLVMAAAPAMLGMLRDELHKEVRNRVDAEVDKNLAHDGLDDLPGHLSHVLYFEEGRYGFDDPRAHKYTPPHKHGLKRKYG